MQRLFNIASQAHFILNCEGLISSRRSLRLQEKGTRLGFVRRSDVQESNSLKIVTHLKLRSVALARF